MTEKKKFFKMFGDIDGDSVGDVWKKTRRIMVAAVTNIVFIVVSGNVLLVVCIQSINVELA